MRKVTERKAEKVLQFVAVWLEQTERRPIPIGKDAAERGIGPMLNMNWDWPSSGATPTILFEEGPDQWALTCCDYVQTRCDLDELDLFVEPYSPWALCIYSE